MQSVEGTITYISPSTHSTSNGSQAVDIEIPGIPNDDLFNWVDQNIPEYDQLIREFPKAGDPYSGWVHVSFNEGNNRRQKFTIG